MASNFTRRMFLRASAILAVANRALPAFGSARALSGASPDPVPSVQNQALPPIPLRGYGVVSGKVVTAKNGGTVLRVETASVQEAKLLQAKYLSDFGVLPGVQTGTLPVGAAHVTVQEAQGQGVVAALRTGNSIYLVAAKDHDQLTSLLKTLPAEALSASVAAVDVPMYLDRWDKFSFRHYYRPWDRPKGTTAATYDYTSDFDFAQQQDRAGVLLALGPLATDSADDMLNTAWGDYAVHECRKRFLPVDVHLAANVASEPTWFMNRYREQQQMKMPGFTGNFHEMESPSLGGQGCLSWNSTTGEDSRLGLLQGAVQKFAAEPNTTSYLEPHGELIHGLQDVLLEYGPVADANYRRYLREQYRSLEVVAKRWGASLASWDDVHVPEFASFAGWGPQALELGKAWRVGYEELLEPVDPTNYGYNARVAPRSKPAPEEWFQAGFDDSTWPTVPGAGHDRQLYLPKRPAVFRGRFTVPEDWKAKNPRAWLYVWDLNTAAHAEIRVVVNGHEVERIRNEGYAQNFGTPFHRSAVDVTSVLTAGENTLAIRVPLGFIAYRTYLSPVEPRVYPDLGESLNARWVDFIDFTAWSRVETVRRGMEMVRQAAPNHPITLMHPDEYSDGIKMLAETYGGEIHNTGYMAGSWADYNSSLMRGADLPYSLEPGGPATSLQEWKKFWGLWQTEGVQSVDYFINIGNILWNPDIKADYEAHRRQISLMGQNHFPKAEVACLYSDRVMRLTRFPWPTPNRNLGVSYWNWNAASVLRGEFPYDSLSPSSFSSGDAKPYRIILDSNTSMMDEAMVAEIEAWVREGGTFITIAQTGRHTPEKADAWPIARLTGYKVTRIDQLNPDGSVDESGTLHAAPSQAIYDSSLNGVRANGLHLEKVAADARNLLLWDDGSVAAGVRPLGKGYIVQLGAKFTGVAMPSRLEAGGDSPEVQHFHDMVAPLLKWRFVPPEPGRLAVKNSYVILRHGVTNNGLYDVWTLWNQSPSQAQTVTVLIENGLKPSFSIDMALGKPAPLNRASLDNVTLEPYETRVFLTPRGRIEQAPLEWFDLQRKWWRGVAKLAPKVLPKPQQRFAREITADWKFQTLDAGADATALLAAHVDDAGWTVRPLSVWDVKDLGGSGHGVFRRNFTVPAEWTDGRASLWLCGWTGATFMEKGRVWLDGREVMAMDNHPYIAMGLPALQAGSTHTLAVEVQSRGVLAGALAQCWLSFEPEPAQKIDLAGQWTPSVDGLRDGEALALPGRFDAQFLRRTLFVDAKYHEQNAVITVDGDHALVGVLINGRLVRRHHHMIGERWSLNLTPFVRFGQDNEIELARWGGSGHGSLREVSLNFFDAGVYP